SSANATPTVNSSTTVINTDPAGAPTISEIGRASCREREEMVHAFAGVTINDPNTAATDTLTRKPSKGGTTGTLSGSGLSGGINGVYTLAAAAATITSELDALVFTTKAGAPGCSTTTAFSLSDLSSANATPTVNSSTTVINTDPAGAPTIS